MTNTVSILFCARFLVFVGTSWPEFGETPRICDMEWPQIYRLYWKKPQLKCLPPMVTDLSDKKIEKKDTFCSTEEARVRPECSFCNCCHILQRQHLCVFAIRLLHTRNINSVTRTYTRAHRVRERKCAETRARKLAHQRRDHACPHNSCSFCQRGEVDKNQRFVVLVKKGKGTVEGFLISFCMLLARKLRSLRTPMMV